MSEPWPEPWPAPVATGPVQGAVDLPGSKSITNRALVLAALADGPGRIVAPLLSRDTLLMAHALSQLGTAVALPDPDQPMEQAVLTVTPGTLTGEVTIDVGNAGTVMRFLPPVACLADGPVRFDGDPRARERPLGPVVEALRTLGADIEAGDRGGLPVTVHGRGGLDGGSVIIDASSSSQFVSALLLAAPRFARGVEVCHRGAPVPSLPHIAMTIAMLRDAGADVDDATPDVWRVAPGPLRGREVAVEPDLSNAAPFLAAAMVTGGEVTVRRWPEATTQAGDALRGIFSDMGGVCDRVGDDLRLRGPAGGVEGLQGLDRDLHDVGELAPVVAAVCALARTPSRLRGIGHLRLHETDRLAALSLELARVGAECTDTADGLDITPVPASSLHGAVLRTYADHRLATAAAVLGLVIPGVGIENVATTAKTLPDFPNRWLALVGTPTGDVAGPHPGTR